MVIDAHTAAVDNDFVNHLIECKLPDSQLISDLQTIFSDLNLTAIMHPLVYENELLIDKHRVALLFSESVIHKVEFNDIFQGNPEYKAYYFYLIEELFHSLRGESFPVSGDQILTYWVRQQSLGEVHSISMCLTCGCGIFLSDDWDSKRLKRYIDRIALGSIEVYNRQELVSKHIEEAEKSLPRSDRQSLTHGISSNKSFPK